MKVLLFCRRSARLAAGFYDQGARTPVLGISPEPEAHPVLDKIWWQVGRSSAHGFEFAARFASIFSAMNRLLCDEPPAVDAFGGEAVVLRAVGLEVALVVA